MQVDNLQEFYFKIGNCHNSNYNSTYFIIEPTETAVWNHPPFPECSQTLPAHCHFLSPVVPGRRELDSGNNLSDVAALQKIEALVNIWMMK